jgi:hypothetical protein
MRLAEGRQTHGAAEGDQVDGCLSGPTGRQGAGRDDASLLFPVCFILSGGVFLGLVGGGGMQLSKPVLAE